MWLNCNNNVRWLNINHNFRWLNLNPNFQVAEFGGILSLFLGFSFMTLWDGVHYLHTALKTEDVFCTKV